MVKDQRKDYTVLHLPQKQNILLILDSQEKDFYLVHTMMEATVSCLLILQRHINSKQKTQKSLCLGNISKDLTITNMKKKKRTGLKGAVNFFSFDFNPIDTNDILDIHKYLFDGKNMI